MWSTHGMFADMADPPYKRPPAFYVGMNGKSAASLHISLKSVSTRRGSKVPTFHRSQSRATSTYSCRAATLLTATRPGDRHIRALQHRYTTAAYRTTSHSRAEQRGAIHCNARRPAACPPAACPSPPPPVPAPASLPCGSRPLCFHPAVVHGHGPRRVLFGRRSGACLSKI